MNAMKIHPFATAIVCAALAFTPAACADDDDATAAPDTASAATGPPSTPTVASPVDTTTAASTPSTAVATAPPPTAPPTTTDDTWKQQAAAFCAAYLAAPPPPDWATAGVVTHVAGLQEIHDRLPSLEGIDYPDDLRAAPADVVALRREADAWMSAAQTAAAADDLAGVITSVEQSEYLLHRVGALLTLGGAQCGDPARATNAALNVLVPHVHHVATGFGSVWASPWFGTAIQRIDPATGDVLASIEVGEGPRRLQPADGRMIVRTTGAYVAIDPATDTAVATLPKSDVGPWAGISHAVDGALWICDGQRLHRYDPTTFQPSAPVIELGRDCGNVQATGDLAVAWTYDEQPGETGTSAAMFIDPATSQLLATVDLPADVGFPIVLDEAVFFPANFGTRNVVVDRTTWSVTATPDYGREILKGPMGFDGRSIYLIADGVDVVVIDATTFELTDTIEPLTFVDKINAVAVGPGALWVATGSAGILQRFDIPS